jgi:phosphoglycolate phosphatase-like HAD superfamily hydrolase
MIAVCRDDHLAHHDACAVPSPGVVAMVRQVRDLGIRTALVTSKIRGSAEHGIRRLGLEARSVASSAPTR